MSSALVLENISFSYEQNEIFSDLNYTFNTGNIYSIMGSNGEGKTTLLNLIYGNLPLKTGSICLLQDNQAKELDDKDVFLIPTVPLLPKFLTGRQFLSLYVTENGCDLEDIDIVLDKLNFHEYDLDKLILNYSTGTIHKLLLACALLSKNKIILLDEPLVSLDFIVAAEVKKILQNLKKDHIILLSTHILEIANEISDEIAIIKDKKIHKIEMNNMSTEQLSELMRMKLLEENNGE